MERKAKENERLIVDLERKEKADRYKNQKAKTFGKFKGAGEDSD